MANSKAKKLVIIDGKSVFYRGYYAMPNLTTADGKSTGGVYGFTTMAFEVMRRFSPDYVAVAWDKPKTNIRKRLAIYPQYKAGRKPAPADFYEQIPMLQKLLEAFGWPLYELDDYEADDIMGTLALKASNHKIETLIVTSDLDMLQLVNPLVSVYILKTGLSNIELYSPKTFEAKYTIKVQQFLDFKALKGDSSDNIPGVPGIGEKTAIDLLQQFNDLDNIYKNIDLINDSVKKKLLSGKDLAYLSKKLAAIWTDAPIDLDLKALDGSKCQPDEVVSLLERYQFNSLLKNLPQQLASSVVGSIRQSDNIMTRLHETKTVIINKTSLLSKLDFASANRVYIYGRSAQAQGAEPKLLILSWDGQTSYAIDVPSVDRQQLYQVLQGLPPIVGYNLKALLKILSNLGFDIDSIKIDHDILLGAFLLNSLNRQLSLSELAANSVGYEGSSLEELDDQELISKAGQIIEIIRIITKEQTQKIDEVQAYRWILDNIDGPIIPVLAKMEMAGIELDCDYLMKISIKMEDMLNDVEQQIYGYANLEFNIASPMQLADVLFNKLQLSTNGIKKTKTGFSTGALELEKLKFSHPIVELIIRYREMAKLKNTYIDTLPKQIDVQSRLHTTFNLTITQTGRLSSTDPNLQNIPVRTSLGREIRTAFVAGANNKLISADYSQFELRLAAVLAEDNDLIELFNRGADIHLMTAAEIYARQAEDVTKQMRSAAKTINFGILYGMSPHGLSIATGMTREQAANFIDKYKLIRRPLFDYMDRVLETAKKVGYVETLFGRRRPMPDIHSSNFAIRSAAERAAVNMPIQGTEADLMKLAMIKCEAIIQQQHYPCRQLLQIHDSVLIECRQDHVDELAKLIQNAMQQVYKLPVRLDVGVAIGDNWGQL